MTDASPPNPAARIRLDDLIDAIRATHDDPLDQLTAAMVAADHLGEMADHLIGHFVDQARRAGASWTAIGAGMGVSKQAAQKRFVTRTSAEAPADNPFASFTPRAANVLMVANARAVEAAADTVTAARIADALADETGSLAATLLSGRGVDADRLHATLAALVPAPGPEDTAAAASDGPTLAPYDAGAKKVLETTVAVAAELGHSYTGTEHLLLGLFADDELAATLTAIGLDAATLRTDLVTALAQVLDKP
ncbi:Clp protease N-terminal domain-containing protein [Gordonia sp. ABSL1-1]|uniref:Clp protease N-terminal domain-containing protein n=1 Tax=Gordonia sp. ABSL1-1 TaxID=3053923 RepID=UPI0025726796|nr:Clp protease N-terminal domain-containing protein [Gordonia sp. ABSL1-1]MDL9937489.1 Clp protease N-terminal domain-containing protein [Gordonia sp. ABSL1-1]